MMLDHLGETEAAAGILAAIESTLATGGDALTRDLGGQGTTASLGGSIARTLAG